MQIQKIARTDPQIVTFTAHAMEAITVGDVVEFDDTAGATYPGVSVEVADSAAATLVAGVALETAASGAFFLVQCYGYNANITSDGTIASAGEVLVSDANGDADVGLEGTQTLGIFAVAMGADAGTVAAGIIRCM